MSDKETGDVPKAQLAVPRPDEACCQPLPNFLLKRFGYVVSQKCIALLSHSAPTLLPICLHE
ncbi:MAG TPA: hypothetical protein VGD99_03745 [Anaerolineae bacterium]|jgi:hypothetical protein